MTSDMIDELKLRVQNPNVDSEYKLKILELFEESLKIKDKDFDVFDWFEKARKLVHYEI